MRRAATVLKRGAAFVAASAATATAAAQPATAPPLLPTGPGSSDVLSLDVIAEHRTGHRFRTLRRASDAAAAGDDDAVTDAGAAARSPPRALAGLTRDARLLGANVRCMLGWCRLAIARAYAVGVYADDAALEAALAAAPGSRGGLSAVLDAKEAGAGPGAAGELSLVLVMARDIAGAHLGHGFRSSGLSRLARRQPRAAGGDAAGDASGARAAALASGRGGAPAPGGAVPAAAESPTAELFALERALAGVDVRVGDELALVWRPDGSAVVTVRGRPVASGRDAAGAPPLELRHPAAIRALFDVYAGDAPVSARLKMTLTSVVERTAAATAAGAKPPDALLRVVLTEHASRTK